MLYYELQVQWPLGLATLGLATFLALATRNLGFLDDQYINSTLSLATYIGFSDLNRVDQNWPLNPAGTVFVLCCCCFIPNLLYAFLVQLFSDITSGVNYNQVYSSCTQYIDSGGGVATTRTRTSSSGSVTDVASQVKKQVKSVSRATGAQVYEQTS